MIVFFCIFSYFLENIGRNLQKCALFDQDQKCVPDVFDFRDFGIDKQGNLCIAILNAPDLQFVGNKCKNIRAQVKWLWVFGQSHENMGNRVDFP